MIELKDDKILMEEEIPVKYDVDILVAGGGGAGFGAAVCAARSGMKTMLVEQQNCLGGLITLGIVNALGGYPEGVAQNLLVRLKEAGALKGFICDHEKVKFVMERMVIESGAKLLYGTSVVDSVVRDNVIKGVVVQNKSGRQAIMAKMVVDCSGDADAAAYAGVPFDVGSEEWSGYNMATSLDFRIGNVNYEKYQKTLPHPSIKKVMMDAVEKGELPYLIDGGHGVGGGGYFGLLPGRPKDKSELYMCIAHSRKCHTIDAEDLTRQLVEQRQQVMWLVDLFRRHMPGFEDCWLVETAPMLGVRDSRRIVGEYVFTAEDLVLARKFPDAVVRESHGFDIHHPTDAEAGYVKHTHLKEPKEPAVCQPDGKGGYEARLKPGEHFEIPYRCLVPLKIDNLLVAGRCYSATFEAQAGSRLIMTCINMGQAAGTAAALAIRNKTAPRNLDVTELKRQLSSQGLNMDKKPALYVCGFARKSLPDKPKYAIGPSDNLVIME